MSPAADIRRSRMIVEEEAHKALSEFGHTATPSARSAVERAIWRALSRESSYRVEEGHVRPLTVIPAGE